MTAGVACARNPSKEGITHVIGLDFAFPPHPSIAVSGEKPERCHETAGPGTRRQVNGVHVFARHAGRHAAGRPAAAGMLDDVPRPAVGAQGDPATGSDPPRVITRPGHFDERDISDAEFDEAAEPLCPDDDNPSGWLRAWRAVAHVIRCLWHGRLRRHDHCWECERPVFGDDRLVARCGACDDPGGSAVLVPDAEPDALGRLAAGFVPPSPHLPDDNALIGPRVQGGRDVRATIWLPAAESVRVPVSGTLWP